MSVNLWKKLVDEISDLQPDAIVLPFWRGESLLHPEFTELLEYALAKSIRIHISTNGQAISSSQSQVLAKCEFLTFSIHTERGLSNARHFLSEHKKRIPDVQLSFVKGEKTADTYLNQIISSPDLNGFDSIRLYEEHTKDGVFGMSETSVDNTNRIYCKKLLDTLVIAYDGTVSRCNHVWETASEINLHDITIKEAWSSDLFKAIRDNYPDNRCSCCDQWIGHTLGESWQIINGKIEHKAYSAE